MSSLFGPCEILKSIDSQRLVKARTRKHSFTKMKCKCQQEFDVCLLVRVNVFSNFIV